MQQTCKHLMPCMQPYLHEDTTDGMQEPLARDRSGRGIHAQQRSKASKFVSCCPEYPSCWRSIALSCCGSRICTAHGNQIRSNHIWQLPHISLKLTRSGNHSVLTPWKWRACQGRQQYPVKSIDYFAEE